MSRSVDDTTVRVDSNSFQNNIFKNIASKSPETEIVVENQSVIALIDTGSQVSTVTEAYFNILLEKKPILHYITRWIKVTEANDLPIPYLGYIELNISVVKTMIPNVGFLVVKDTDNNSKNSPKISCVKIAGSSPIHIPGNSMTTVMCTTRQKDKTEKYCAVVQSLQGNQGPLPRNIMVVDSYAEISQGTVPVRMINKGLEDVWINQKTRVGTLHLASLIHEVSQESIDIDIDETQINVQIEKIDIAVCKQATTNIENNKKIQLNDLDIEQENLTHEQIEKVKDLLNKNTDIFCKNDLDIGYTDIVKHRILTTDEKPIAIPHRRIPTYQMEEVRAHIKQLLNQNIIRKSSSPYAAPVVIVRKHDKSIRLNVDYRLLNKKTIRDANPFPRIEEALDTLHGTKFYTTRRSVRTPGVCVSTTKTALFEIKISKCHFFKKEVRYLGHVISQDGIKTNPDKTKSIQDWKVPTNEKELRSYLGLRSYYRKFVPKFSKIAAPLHSLTTKSNGKKGKSKQFKLLNAKEFQEKWDAKCLESFEELKHKLTIINGICLTHKKSLQNTRMCIYMR
ncbi:unnamed protein product [Mytilus coruscus]|uniref:Peptidase A2 domain-containing protein n=1 Tax=Mytilus coruscus TaxID=42192 RepID=A0A6J8D288_MYTCO|nr:unnamed protein product [Mytilus coruscus]